MSQRDDDELNGCLLLLCVLFILSWLLFLWTNY